MKRKIGIIDLLFALLVHVCRMHSILIYEYDFYCGLKHRIYFQLILLWFIFQIHVSVIRNSEIAVSSDPIFNGEFGPIYGNEM